jgi:hypothetical protein
VSCSRDRVGGAHALEAYSSGAGRFAWNSDGVFGTGTQIEIASLWSRSGRDHVPHNRADPLDRRRVARAYAIQEIVESVEQTIVSNRRPSRISPSASKPALTGAQSWGRSRRPSAPTGRICVRYAGDAEDADRARVSGR